MERRVDFTYLRLITWAKAISAVVLSIGVSVVLIFWGISFIWKYTPPELKIAQGGKGVLKEAARRVIPSEVIDRPKGYFPVPALTHLEGPYLDLVRDALYSPVAKERGLFDTDAVDALLADPNGKLTPLRGNELWQIALLELWLQRHGVMGSAA